MAPNRNPHSLSLSTAPPAIPHSAIAAAVRSQERHSSATAPSPPMQPIVWPTARPRDPPCSRLPPPPGRMAHAGERCSPAPVGHTIPPQRHAAPAIHPHGRRPAIIRRGLHAVSQSCPGRTPPASTAPAGRRRDLATPRPDTADPYSKHQHGGAGHHVAVHRPSGSFLAVLKYGL
jgi:hypothetical protein